MVHAMGRRGVGDRLTERGMAHSPAMPAWTDYNITMSLFLQADQVYIAVVEEENGGNMNFRPSILSHFELFEFLLR